MTAPMLLAAGGTRLSRAFSRSGFARAGRRAGCRSRAGRGWLCGLILLFAGVAHAAEVIPPAPDQHFNDYAGVVAGETASRLNAALVQTERDTSNQIVVAIYPHMQSDSSIEDYTVRVAQAWGVGQKGRKNGAVLFIFTEDRTLFIQVGYGLEGVLPDATCKRIIEDEITPRFRAGDYSGGVTAGVQAMLAATRGEYRGSGRTARDARDRDGGLPSPFVIVVVIVMIIGSLFSRRRNVLYQRGGRRSIWFGGGGPGSWGGGGGGGGTFSGGGGSFGGGGAGGRW